MVITVCLRESGAGFYRASKECARKARPAPAMGCGKVPSNQVPSSTMAWLGLDGLYERKLRLDNNNRLECERCPLSDDVKNKGNQAK